MHFQMSSVKWQPFLSIECMWLQYFHARLITKSSGNANFLNISKDLKPLFLAVEQCKRNRRHCSNNSTKNRNVPLCLEQYAGLQYLKLIFCIPQFSWHLSKYQINTCTYMFPVVNFDALAQTSDRNETSYLPLLTAGFEPRLSDTKWPADWMLSDKLSELSRIKLKTWARQPVPLISEHSAHSTPLPVGFRTWLWRYTCLLLHAVHSTAWWSRSESLWKGPV